MKIRAMRLGWVAPAAVMLWCVATLPASDAVAPGDGPPEASDQRRELEHVVRGQRKPQVDEIELSPAVRRLVDDKLISEADRRRHAVFHGLWDEVTEPTVAERAAIALQTWEPSDPAFEDEATPALLRAEAALRRGEPARAMELLAGAASAQADLLRARALVSQGRHAEAIAVLTPWRDTLQHERVDDAAELTAGAEALVLLAELEGRPAADYHLALRLLERAREELDRYYWPAFVAEAKLLASKDNPQQAAEALAGALQLNLKAAEAWYLLGTLAVHSWDFAKAEALARKLREVRAEHPLADLLEARSSLMQRDADGARRSIDAARRKLPHHEEVLALHAAAYAIAYDEAATDAALAAFDARYPGHAVAYAEVGRYLAVARQYDWAARVLAEAVNRRPNWPAPRVELGLLLMDAGKPEDARHQLREAVRLDPFNARADNQLRLVDELLGFETLETDRFIIRYKAGIDEVLARDMPEPLERMHREITEAFGFVPAAKTQIDILPDEQKFSVRITGMPHVFTMAAATGDVIGLTPPRHGPKQWGTYHWLNVVRHEFVHTVTLAQTINRVPRWFTEAAAVSQEIILRRNFETNQMLASALHKNQLIPFDQLDWAFVRGNAGLAYAQSDWMLEFIAARFGHDAILTMLERYRDGSSGAAALEAGTGLAPGPFMEAFRAWAAEQVESWGLGQRDPLSSIVQGARPQELTVAAIDELLQLHPRHPDLLKLRAQRLMDAGDAAAAREAVLRYAGARPVDPWSHQQLVLLAGQLDRPEEAIASLEVLDRLDNDSGAWSHQLALIHRQRGDLPQAADAIQRALYREPYNGTYRELSAAIALQRGDLDRATHDLYAMTRLEPQRSMHFVRLAAVHARAGRTDEARLAAEQARQLDPEAPVARFLGP